MSVRVRLLPGVTTRKLISDTVSSPLYDQVRDLEFRRKVFVLSIEYEVNGFVYMKDVNMSFPQMSTIKWYTVFRPL